MLSFRYHAHFCPWLGGWDRNTPFIYVSTRNHCYSPNHSDPLTPDRQSQYCLKPEYSNCPGFSKLVEDRTNQCGTPSRDIGG